MLVEVDYRYLSDFLTSHHKLLPLPDHERNITRSSCEIGDLSCDALFSNLFFTVLYIETSRCASIQRRLGWIMIEYLFLLSYTTKPRNGTGRDI